MDLKYKLNLVSFTKRKINDEDKDDKLVEAKRSKLSSSQMDLFTSIKENINIKWIEKLLNNKKNKVTIGYFDLLPDEIFLKILKYLNVQSLGTLSHSNSKIRNFIIENFLLSSSGYKHLIRPKSAKNDVVVEIQLQQFKSIGLFLKKATFVFPTSDRLYLLIKILEHTYGIPTIKTFCNIDYNNTRLMYKCYTKIINNLTRGWGDSECVNVFETLKETFQIDQYVSIFRNATLGSKQKEELFIRHFFRMICSTSNETGNNFKEKLFWLTHTFKNCSIEEMAKVLILIFGPLITVNSNLFPTLPYVAWWDLIDAHFVKNGLEDLGIVFFVLYRYKEDSIWKQEYLIQLFEKVIITPELWADINVATLLYYMGFEFSLNFLRKKLQDGELEIAATYICYLSIITHKFTQSIGAVVNMIDTLIDVYNIDILHLIAHQYNVITLELLQFEDEDDLQTVDLQDIIETLIDLMKHEILSKRQLKKSI